MVKVGDAESNFEPGAWNCDSTAGGVFQILDGTWKLYACEGNKYDARDNITCAKKIYDVRGTKDWNASKGTWKA